MVLPIYLFKRANRSHFTFHVARRAVVSGVLQLAGAKPWRSCTCFCSTVSNLKQYLPWHYNFSHKEQLRFKQKLAVIRIAWEHCPAFGFPLVLLEEEVQCFSLEMSSQCKFSTAVVLWFSISDYVSNLWKKLLSNGKFLKQRTIVVSSFENSQQAWIKTIRNIEL